MTPEEELMKYKKKKKRNQRDLYYFIVGFVLAFALVGFTILSTV